MFRQLTENPYKPAGKLATENTIKNIATQYTLGRPEWEQPWPQEVKYERVQQRTGNQICFGTDKLEYVTNTHNAFNGEVPIGYQKAKPFRDKATLQQTQYSLGEDRIQYKTAAQMQFQDPKKQQSKEQPIYKNYNQRVDIITGQVYDKNKRSYAFEGYSEDPQHKKSQNQTVLPQDLYVNDPITGRRIIRKIKDDN